MRKRAWTISVSILAIPAAIAFVNHGYGLVSAFSEDTPGKDIVVPDMPLQEDHAFGELSKIAGQLDQTIDNKDCLGTKPPYQLDHDCLVLLKAQAGVLAEFDAWLAKPATYKLERPANLDRHSRIPIVVELTATPPDLIQFKRLATMLALRSLNRLGTGRAALGRQDLHTIFSLGDFFQQNPSVVSQMIGIKLYDTALKVLVMRIPLAATGEGLEAMLPVPQHILDGARVAIGETWLSQRDLFEQEFSFRGRSGNYRMAIVYILGWYSPEYALRLLDRCFYRDGLTQIANGKLGTSFYGPRPSGCGWDDMGLIKWVHQPFTRILVSIGGPSIASYNARTGQTIDRVQATRVVIAARKFWHQKGHWPSQENDLVPAFLNEWPRSALDGQALHWMDDRKGLFILARDGRSRCQAEEFCQFPFEPPHPVSTISERLDKAL